MAEDSGDIAQYLVDHAPELILIVAGLIMLLIVYTYLRDKESAGYKAAVVLGVIVGIGMVLMLVTYEDQWYAFGTMVIAIAAFTLIIRPFKDVNFAIVVAAMVALVAWVWLGTLSDPLEFLAEGWPRIIVSLMIGAVIYAFLNFVQKLAQLLGKLLNLWPVLFIFGVLCIVEGALILSGSPSLLDYYHGFKDSGEVAIAFLAGRAGGGLDSSPEAGSSGQSFK